MRLPSTLYQSYLKICSWYVYCALFPRPQMTSLLPLMHACQLNSGRYKAAVLMTTM